MHLPQSFIYFFIQTYTITTPEYMLMRPNTITHDSSLCAQKRHMVSILLFHVPSALNLTCKNPILFHLCQLLSRLRVGAFHGLSKPVFCLFAALLRIDALIVEAPRHFHAFSIAALCRLQVQFKGFLQISLCAITIVIADPQVVPGFSELT